MMSVKKIFFMLPGIALLIGQAIAADDIVLTINGKLTGSPCTIDSASVTQEVNFSQTRSTDLKRAGSAGKWLPFSVGLGSCPPGTSVVTVTFRGTAFSDDPTLFANAGSAENVGVQMAQDPDHTRLLGPGSTMSVRVDAQNKATFPLAGRLYSVTGNTSPGSFSSVIQMDMTYQ